MVRVITQETFDAAVKENMDEFSMGAEEAIQDAVEQFKAQGVNLTNIVTDHIMSVLALHPKASCADIVNELKNLLSNSDSSTVKIVDNLQKLSDECNQDLAHKMLAAEQDAYNVILDTIEIFEYNPNITIPALKTLTLLMTGQPDLLDDRGLKIMFKFLKEHENRSENAEVLLWISECCVKHEQNRQIIIRNNISLYVKQFLEDPEVINNLIINSCILLRNLTLDDDIRVQFGKAHDHARMLAVELLAVLISLLQKYSENIKAAENILKAITSLIVRNEFCQQVYDLEGLKYIMDSMVNFMDNEEINFVCLKLLKGLAGNDDVKVQIINVGAASLIISAMQRHKSNANVACAGCEVIAALSLRCIPNSIALSESGAPEIILQVMHEHSNNAYILKQGSWAIRNMVARVPSLISEFTDRNAEEILQAALEKFGPKLDFDVKSALKDLGCQVQLKEEWTGKGGLLN